MSDQQTSKLLKPRFIKIKDLQRGRNGYNVYAKVIQATPKDIQTQDGRTIKMIDAVIGDQTGSAKGFFKGQEVSFIKKGQVIAIRNGMRKMIKGHISLQIDMFGRVTKEDGVQIKIVEAHNISDTEFQSSIRREGTQQGRPQRRPQSSFRNQQRPNRSQDRRPSRDRRPNRNNNSFNAPKRNQNGNFGNNSSGNNQRSFQRQGRNDNRDNNRYKNNQQRDGDFNRRYDSSKQKPKPNQRARYEQKKVEERQQRPATQFSKINQIEPGQSDLNILAQIIKVTQVKGKTRDMVRCVLGDETGTVNAFLPDDNLIIEGDTIAIFRCESKVVKEHIEMQLGPRGRIDRGKRPIKTVNEEYDLSSKAWVPVE